MNLWNLNDKDLRKAAKQIKIENRELPPIMTRLRDSEFADQAARSTQPLVEIWRSCDFLCQIYRVSDEVERLSICRSIVDVTNRRWRDGISWDELMQVKREVGRGDFDAVEVLPADRDIVNVANMRHVWVLLKTPLPFTWRANHGR